MLWVKDGKIYQGGGVVVGNMRHFNPSPEQFIAAGYTEYIPPTPEPDPKQERYLQEFEAACAQFRQLCNQIKVAAGLDSFTGGFDEMTTFQQTPIYQTLDGVKLAIAWSAANELCKYTGAKIGYGQPEWWYECWRAVEEHSEDLESQDTSPEATAEDPVEDTVPNQPTE